MPLKPQGRKEVGEAVVIAGLCALVVGAVNWGIESAKAKWKEIEEKRKKKDEDAPCP